jgi:antitoxin (DNA-binding transcriptional repressor) of toxin-antitoxin stability system
VIRAVRAGTDVVLTDRGRPVAVVSGVPVGDDQHARLRTLEDVGLIRLALRSTPMPAATWRPVAIAGEPIASTIDRDRDESA